MQNCRDHAFFLFAFRESLGQITRGRTAVSERKPVSEAVNVEPADRDAEMPGLWGNLPRSATDKGGTSVRELLCQAAQLDGWSNLSPLKLKPQILDTELVNLPCWVSIFFCCCCCSIFPYYSPFLPLGMYTLRYYMLEICN